MVPPSSITPLVALAPAFDPDPSQTVELPIVAIYLIVVGNGLGSTHIPFHNLVVPVLASPPLCGQDLCEG